MFSSRDLLIKQRIQTLLSDHAKANGQLYLPDDRRIYFHYFKGWKERSSFFEGSLLPILFVFMRNETAYIRFGIFDFLCQPYKKDMDRGRRMTHENNFNYVSYCYVFCYRIAASIFNKMIVLLPCKKHRLFNFILCIECHNKEWLEVL